MEILNKEAIQTFLSSKLGDTFNPEELEEQMKSWVLPAEEPETEVEETATTQNETSEEEQEVSGEEEVDLSDIDPNELDPIAKKLYDKLLEVTETSREKQISIAIGSSGLDEKHVAILERMAKNGMDISEIEATIADFKEIEESKKRKKGTALPLIFSSSKTKTPQTKKQTETKVGTVDFGRKLARK